MSRLIVKNLPSKVSNEDIKKHFSQKGCVTDVKLVYKDGVFRRYGFVGFEKEEEAQNACDYFNNTFIKYTKIVVEVCQDFDQGSKPMSWKEKNKLKKKALKGLDKNNSNSKIADVNSEINIANQKSKKGNNAPALLRKYENDLDYKEFMKGSKGVGENTIVDDEVPVSDDSAKGDNEDDENANVNIAHKYEMSDLDYLKSLKASSKKDFADSSALKTKNAPKGLKELFHVVIRIREVCKIRQNKSKVFSKRNIKDFLKPLKWKSLRIPPRTKFVAYVGFETEREMRRALQKDKSFLNGARVQVMRQTEVVKNTSNSHAANAPWQCAKEKLKNAEPVAESGKIFVRNLWYSVTEDDLRELFEQYGKITEISLPICKITRKSMGFAVVTFMFPEHSVRAMTGLDGKSFKGRMLHILPAHTQEEQVKGDESFKSKKDREQKATASSWHNWNTLFLGSGAVIDIMAEKYNKSKQEILNAEGKQSVAVNLALGETQIVAETRRFLEDNGISLDAFTTPGVQRSNTVVLVKNLPANTSAQELHQIFSKYGELGRVVLPPAGVTGIVEYLDPGEAKKGFRSLAYSRFHYTPLYLEWAPQRVFKKDLDISDRAKPSDEKKPEEYDEEANQEKKDKEELQKEKPKEKPESLPDPEPDTTIYVKNLNFTTTEEVLKKHFKKVGAVHSVMIARRRNMSQGYGFVQFVRQAHTQKALREMQETLLEERNLQLKLSEKILATTVKSARMMHDFGKQNSTKILVKNIPFEAARKEVHQLFATFGELKSVRLPNKPGTLDHRGFGFIDFVTQDEAKKAFDALCHSTHLYGRRLVLEWAKDDDTVEELRQKTAEQFLSGSSPLKKRKIADMLERSSNFDDQK